MPSATSQEPAASPTTIAAEIAQLEADLAKVPALQQRIAYLAGMRDCLTLTTSDQETAP